MANYDDIIVIKKIFAKYSTDTDGIMGTLAVIRFLYHIETKVTSKQISDELNVSSARMTILLKKLEKDNIIVKEKSQEDAREINIKLTEHGIKKAQELTNSVNNCIEKLLDIFGLEELIDLLNKMNVFKNVFKDNLKLDLKGELND